MARLRVQCAHKWSVLLSGIIGYHMCLNRNLSADIILDFPLFLREMGVYSVLLDLGFNNFCYLRSMIVSSGREQLHILIT